MFTSVSQSFLASLFAWQTLLRIVLILGPNGGKFILFLWTNLHGKCGAAEAAENFNKIPKLCKIYLKNGENSYGIGDIKIVRHNLFFCCNS